MNAIEVDHISKRYRLFHDRPTTLKESALRLIRGGGRESEEFWALKDVSFGVRPGESVGLIGENGSGKTTLFKLIAKILDPDEGSIRVNGKVSSLLELGAGFHPELTGRENVYLYCSILGLKRERVHRIFDDIVSFAGLERFIDTPLRSYSSGMHMRLGFACAIHVDPEILLVDEVLAVGDIAFQKKCFGVIEDFIRRGKTIFLVTHDMSEVKRVCRRTLVLHEGRLVFEGSTPEAVDTYVRMLEEKAEAATRKGGETTAIPYGYAPGKVGTREIMITQVDILDGAGVSKESFLVGETMRIRIGYRAGKRIEGPVFGLAIHRRDGLHMIGPNTKEHGPGIDLVEPGEGEVEFEIREIPFASGDYEVTVAVHDSNIHVAFDYHTRLYRFKVVSDEGKMDRGAVLDVQGNWRIESRAGEVAD